MKVLIADDNRDAALSLGMLLELGNHEVLMAHDGDEALRLARTTLPEALILDIGMPGLTGEQVAHAIRQERWGAGVLMIALTGWGDATDKERASSAGFDHHLTKPVDLERVEKLLGEFAGDPDRH